MAAASCPPPLPIPPFPFPTIFLAASLSFAAIVFLFLFINSNRKMRQMDHCKQEQEQQQKQKQQMDVSKWGDFALAASPPPPPTPTLVGDERKEGGAEGAEEKKRKKRGRKKKQDGVAGSDGGDDLGCAERDRVAAAAAAEGGKCGEDSMYPFSSFSSATQRRIKQQYDEIVKSNAAKALTMVQVGQFANCLIETRNDLHHKSEVIQRKFTITKALLFKADRSSFGRHCQQIYKLEAEQKRLEEDAVVYNRLQEQLKLSPAFKTMIEIGTQMESKAEADQSMRTIDSEFADISFEELLAQEKKDSFWQRNGKMRSCTS